MLKRFRRMVWIGALLILTCSSVSFSAEKTVYEFDEIDVLNAMQFQVQGDAPSESMKGQELGWLYQLAGGDAEHPSEPVTVIYGKVGFKKEGKQIFTEDFISLTGKNGSVRYLSNSFIGHTYSESSTYKDQSYQFWSGKQINGTNVIKDYTGTIQALWMTIQYEQDGKIKGIVITADQNSPNFLTNTPEQFDPSINTFRADLSTLTMAERMVD